jgi:hypothetical protein
MEKKKVSENNEKRSGNFLDRGARSLSNSQAGERRVATLKTLTEESSKDSVQT